MGFDIVARLNRNNVDFDWDEVRTNRAFDEGQEI